MNCTRGKTKHVPKDRKDVLALVVPTGRPIKPQPLIKLPTTRRTTSPSPSVLCQERWGLLMRGGGAPPPIPIKHAICNQMTMAVVPSRILVAVCAPWTTQVVLAFFHWRPNHLGFEDWPVPKLRQVVAAIAPKIQNGPPPPTYTGLCPKKNSIAMGGLV